MDIASRLIAPIARISAPAAPQIDLEAFVLRLLLFDHYVLASIRLLEIPSLLSAFSHAGLVKILRSGAVSIECFPVHTASLSPSLFVNDVPPGTIRPPFHYSLATVSLADPLQHINASFTEIRDQMALTNRQERTLRKALYDCLTPTDDSQGEMALRSTRQEIPQNHELLALTCSMAAMNMLGKDIPRSEIAVSPTALTDNDYRVDSNLQTRFHLGQLDAHRVIESGILAIAQRNDRIEQMQRHSALSGFSEDDLPVFGEKLSFLEESLSPEAHERRIRRVIELRGLPRIPSDQPIFIDAKRILELRESPECIQFRRWLSSTEEISDEEISSLSTSVVSRLGGFIRTGAGRAMRFLVTTGAGVLPPLGIALSAADQFILERIFPSPGPIAFVDTIYPSLFKAPEE